MGTLLDGISALYGIRIDLASFSLLAWPAVKSSLEKKKEKIKIRKREENQKYN